LLSLSLALPLSGCSSGFARLDGVLVDGTPAPRPARAGEPGRVVVTRASANEPGRRGMPIGKGDALATNEDGVGLLVLADGYEVIMESRTDLTIENPSIFVRAGRVIIKRVKQLREKLTVRTELGAAVVEGTEFVFEVDTSRQVKISVLEGLIRVYPLAARWTDTTTYVAGEQVVFDSLRITRLPPLAAAEVTALRRRIDAVERVAKPVKPFWQKPVFIVPAVAAGVAAAILIGGNGSDIPVPPTRNGTVTVDFPL
jgi:ferric-dicitrate binding protein FerR (iron transport regulator)